MNEELNVNAGDEVLYICGTIGFTEERIVKVVRVTPKGRIRIDFTDAQFDRYGRLMGNVGAYSNCLVRKLTDDDRKRIKEAGTINKALNMLNNSKLTYEQAKKIIEILEDGHDRK